MLAPESETKPITRSEPEVPHAFMLPQQERCQCHSSLTPFRPFSPHENVEKPQNPTPFLASGATVAGEPLEPLLRRKVDQTFFTLAYRDHGDHEHLVMHLVDQAKT